MAVRVILALCILLVFIAQGAVNIVTTCTTVINVSGTYSDDGCVLVNGTETVFLCSSLQAALDLGSHQLQKDDNCTEIILSSGEQFSILYPIAVNSSLVLRSSDPPLRAQVTVSAERTSQPPDYPPFYVLTVSNAKLAVISGVEFFRSSGIISIVSVDNAFVSDCVFR